MYLDFKYYTSWMRTVKGKYSEMFYKIRTSLDAPLSRIGPY